ncbi:MAG: anti-sigma factor family protein [Gemmatimonadota bacterium]
MTGHAPECERALSLLYDFLDGELPAATHEEVAAHLEQCRDCYPYFNFQRLFLDRLSSTGDAPEERPDVSARIRSFLESVAD